MHAFHRILPAATGLLMIVAASANGATITVDSVADGIVLILPGQPVPPPPCTLRDAITAANTNKVVNGCAKGDPGIDTIEFDVGVGTPTIRPRTMLPVIIEPITINGKTGGATRVEIDGSVASRTIFLGRVDGLYLVGGGSTIRSLVINRFSGNGIVLSAITGGALPDPTPPTIPEETIPDCFRQPQPPDCLQGGGGGGAPDIPPIGGAGASNTIVDCLIGTDSSGTVAFGNGSGNHNAGIVVATDLNTIGGPVAAERNVISGNRGHGLILAGRANWVRGNFIGTDVTGALALGNRFDGINIAGGQFSSATGAVGANLNSADRPCGMVLDRVTGRVINDRRECANLIAFNDQNGITGGLNAYLFLSNSIHSNGSLGISVAPAGTRNAPVLTSWIRQFLLQPPFIGTRVSGSITNAPSRDVIIQLFHSWTCDPSNHGEGQDYLGSVRLSGNGNFNFFLPRTGGYVTATSSTTSVPWLWSSDFSACLAI
jgi:hypothetical protein